MDFLHNYIKYFSLLFLYTGVVYNSENEKHKMIQVTEGGSVNITFIEEKKNKIDKDFITNKKNKNDPEVEKNFADLDEYVKKGEIKNIFDKYNKSDICNVEHAILDTLKYTKYCKEIIVLLLTYLKITNEQNNISANVDNSEKNNNLYVDIYSRFDDWIFEDVIRQLKTYSSPSDNEEYDFFEERNIIHKIRHNDYYAFKANFILFVDKLLGKDMEIPSFEKMISVFKLVDCQNKTKIDLQRDEDYISSREIYLKICRLFNIEPWICN